MPRRTPPVAALVVLLAALVPAGAGAADAPRCPGWSEERNVYFGDLHVHTAFSLDASTQGTRGRPHDAYRFARGQALGIQPYDASGAPTREVKLARPLDFAAVTDHAEVLGETTVCSTPGFVGHDSLVCQVYRRWPRAAFFVMNWRASRGQSRWDFCGPGGVYCLDAAETPWGEIRAAAAAANAPCSFTTFVGYEWTAARDYFNLHRNVIFRSEDVPALPVSFYEAGTAVELWASLRRTCVDAGGDCDALVIPHNSNLSGGLMFPEGRLPAEDARALAEAEPLVEVMQHKGGSECALPDPTGGDELCSFEALPYDGFVGKFVPVLADPPPPTSFVRSALARGLVLQDEVGANPFRFGLIASTDTHLATPGLVSERDFPGHGGAGKPALDGVPSGFPDELEFNPGGLAAVWAEQNDRDSIFRALRRREAYGTSGPRLRVRLFAGWDFDPSMCGDASFAARGYADGVPMGGALAGRPEGATGPTLAVQALRDPGSDGPPGVPLERIQIVKGWMENGEVRETVVDVAGAAGRGGVDLSTCQPQGTGADALCAVWSDPAFDPGTRAYYYARVLENPTCRWSQWVCVEAGVDCADPASVDEGLEACCSPEHRPEIQERAWTSPVWYEPGGAAAR